jgi:hypothetical protein
MGIIMRRALPLIIGLTLGNLFYQAVLANEPNWFLAIDRSFFQIIAIAAYIFFTKRENG